MLFSLLRRPMRAGVLVAAATLAACDVPTDPPIFQQTWVVPGDSVVIGVSNLLPSDVRIDSAATPRSFALATQPGANIGTSLGTICGTACTTANGQTINKPFFESPASALSASVAFPAGVKGVTVSGGTLRLVVSNNLGFDPLRPAGMAAADTGVLEVRVTSGPTSAPTVSSTTRFLSTTRTMLNGQPTQFDVALPTGTYGDTIRIVVVMRSPAGGPVSINTANTLTVAASVQGIAFSQASVAVANKTFNSPASSFDLSDVDADNRVQGGGLRLSVVNPFAAQATMNLVLRVPAAAGQMADSIVKAVQVAPSATTNTNVAISQAELRRLLGKTGVQVYSRGTVSGTGAGNAVTVTPTQEIKIRTQLELTLNIGGSN